MDEAKVLEGVMDVFDMGADAVEVDAVTPTLEVTVAEISVFAATAALALPQVDPLMNIIPKKPLPTNRETDFLLSTISTADRFSLGEDALWTGAGDGLFAGVNA